MRRSPRTRTLLISAVSIVLAVTIGTTSAAGAASGFGDVDEDRYYTDAVAWMVGNEITTGVESGCFGPGLSVTRGQLAAFLHRLDISRGNDPATSAHPFADVTSTYQESPIGWLYGQGLTTGISPTSFAPDRPVSRGDFAVLLWRYAGSPRAAAALPFVDVTAIYQQSAVAWMAETGITTGTSDTAFSPNGLVTRAEAATFLFRFVDPVAVEAIGESVKCTRSLRLALELNGLTRPEALCAAPYLIGFEIDYLLAVVHDRDVASFELLIAAAAIGNNCLSPDRIADLSRLFL